MCTNMKVFTKGPIKIGRASVCSTVQNIFECQPSSTVKESFAPFWYHKSCIIYKSAYKQNSPPPRHALFFDYICIQVYMFNKLLSQGVHRGCWGGGGVYCVYRAFKTCSLDGARQCVWTLQVEPEKKKKAKEKGAIVWDDENAHGWESKNGCNKNNKLQC